MISEWAFRRQAHFADRKRALAIFTGSLGQDHRSTQTVARNLAALGRAIAAAAQQANA